MTDEEVLVLLGRGNSERAAAKATFEQAFALAESEVARCWAAHMVAVVTDKPEEKLRWNLESLRAAEAAAPADPRASSLFPTVLANVGFSELLMARPIEARRRYEQARRSLDEAADLSDERRDGYRTGIEHMLAVIDASTDLPGHHSTQHR